MFKRESMIGLSVWTVGFIILWAAEARGAYTIPTDVEYHAIQDAPGEGNWEVQPGLPGSDWGDPEWLFDDQDVKSQLKIPNRARPEPWRKTLYLLMTFDTAEWDETDIPEMSVAEPQTGVSLKFSDVSLGTGTAYWEWQIVPQPASETLQFPGWFGYDMHNHMTRLEVASKCVPEPSAGLGGLGLLIALASRRRTGRGRTQAA